MIPIHPFIYRFSASSCAGLSIMPLDILQTKILSHQEKVFKPEELKLTILLPLIFSIQNSVYEWSKFLPNQSLRGITAGLAAAPLYIFVEIKKLKMRLDIYPYYKKYIFWMTLRELIVYTIIYNVLYFPIPYAKFFAPLTANSVGFIFKLIAYKSAYPSLHITSQTIKSTCLIEIIKSSIGDGLALFLIYSLPKSSI